MAELFAFLFLIALIGTVVCLVKPSLTQIKSKPALPRKKIFLYGLTLNFVFLALVGVFAPEVEPKAEVKQDQLTAATPKKAEVQSETAKKDIQPFKTEASLGMTPEQFRQKFNAQLKALDIDTIRPVAEFDIKTGDVRDTFQVMFSQDVGMTGIVNKDGLLREIVFIVGGTDDYQNATMDLIILTGITAKVFSPSTEAGNELLKLMTTALKNIGQENNTHEKVFGDVKYYALANEVTGLWVGVSPIDN